MSLAVLREIPASLAAADASDAGIQWLRPFTPGDDPTVHELVFFLKPELLVSDAGVKLDAVLEMLIERLGACDVSLGSLAVLSAAYLDRHDVMQGHYGVINKVSRLGEAAISEDAKAKLRDAFGALIAGGAPVLGGHQILEAHPGLTPAAFDEFWERKRSTKLAGGTYAVDVDVDGKTVVALNGFHPEQVNHFIAPGRRIAVAAVRSTRGWADLRGKLIGATDPAKAADGSIRADLLARKDKLGLAEVNQGFNGVHLSAGPLEGLVELVRFTSDRAAGTERPVGDTCFGRLLAQAGTDEARIRALMDNPDLDADGKPVSAFDLTEEVDAADAVRALL